MFYYVKGLIESLLFVNNILTKDYMYYKNLIDNNLNYRAGFEKNLK